MRRLLVILIAFALLLAAHNGWVAVAPSASTTDNLNGVALVSASDGWTVGDGGTIQHFDGSSWTLIASGTASDLFGVSFGPPPSPNPNAGFAVGGSGGTASALYWGGVSWFPILTGLSAPAAQKLSSVFEVSPTDAWAVDSISGAFWQWSGSAGLGGGWNNVGFASAGLNSIYMTSPTDGWAVGVGGIIYRFSGGSWVQYTSVGQTLNSVFMVNENEGWAVGSGGVIYHYSSGVWTGPMSPAPTDQNLNSIFMVSSSEGWAVGASGTILHYVNGVWTLVQNPSGTGQDLNSVSFAGTSGWAVGNLGTLVSLTGVPPTPTGLPSATLESVYLTSSSDGWIVGCSTGGCGSGAGEPVLIHWNGNSFTRGTSSAITSDLFSVYMLNPSEGWAVGGIGTTPVILHYTGGAWTQVPAPPIGGVLRGVFMIDSGDGWAVGDGGAILRYSEGSWAAVSSPTSNSLRAIFMLGSSDGWAAGGSGTILRYQEGVWSSYASPTSSQLNSLYLMDSSHGWAVGASGTILNFDGSVWLSVTGPVSTNLNSVAQVNPQLAWAVGDSATILEWNGIGWYQFAPAPPLSGTPDLNSIYILPNGFGFVAGAPSAPGSQATVLQAPNMSPIPETTYPQLLLWATFASTFTTTIIRKRRSHYLNRQPKS
jgi:photosystem II stability/assembly factor-like uncharacterized protein